MPPLDVSHDGGVVAELKASSCGCFDEQTARSHSEYDDPYAPAESLRLRIGGDIDWSDVVVGGAAAAVLERDDSTKGAAANPKSCAARRSSAAGRSSLSAHAQPVPRAAAAVCVVIGGLPAKAARGHRRPCQLQLGLGGRARVFASGDAAAAAAGRHQQAEPGSPKVSCMGGVRSQSQPRTTAESITSGGRRWWAWLLADVMFCCCLNNARRQRRSTASDEEAE